MKQLEYVQRTISNSGKQRIQRNLIFLRDKKLKNYENDLFYRLVCSDWMRETNEERRCR